jgi:electron transfer flavoprotein alpha subunit
VNKKKPNIWVLGDYRNYFQNRVTLQLLARANKLAEQISASVCAVVIGHEIGEWVGEYVAHGAEKVFLMDDPRLKDYSLESYSFLTAELAKVHQPEIILIGATQFGREFGPKLAKKLKTGLTSDCIDLDINQEGLLVQTAPAFGGNLLARIITPETRPQMATVRPGAFQERPHDARAKGEIIRVPVPEDLPKDRVRLLDSKRHESESNRIEDAPVVICGGRGMGSKKKFKKLFELAELMGGQVGATRPVVHEDWIDEEALVGQSGTRIHPKILFSFGISGAIQHRSGITDAGFTIAVNKNPEATMMKTADVAIVADAAQFCSALIKELRKRIRN